MSDDVQEAFAILGRIAPPDRMCGWHTEECFLDVETWVESQDDFEWTPAPHPERVAKAELDMYWQGRVTSHERAVAEYLEAHGAPTDEQMCDEACEYPRVRALLNRVGEVV